MAEHDRIPTDTKYTNPRITHDGKYWHISVGVGQEIKGPELTGETNKTPKGKVGENRYKFTKTKNTEKLEKETRLINRRLGNIRLNHIQQATSIIVKTKPSRIVVEDLNVKGMIRNRHLSKAIAEQCFSMFVIILTYKCLLYRIDLVEAENTVRYAGI